MQPQQQQNNFSGWNDRLTKIEEGIASLTDQFKNFQNPGNEPLGSIGDLGPTQPTQPFPTQPSQPLDPQNPTGDALVHQIQMRMQQQDVKPPAWNAYAKDVMDTGGYPTKTIQEYYLIYINR